MPDIITSMTGFARAEGRHGGFAWAWELRSVNGRTLEVRARVAAGFERAEPIARAEVARRFKRGNIQLNLTVGRGEAGPRVTVNRPLLDQLIRLSQELGHLGLQPPSLDGLLAIRGVIEAPDETAPGEDPALAAALDASLAQALDRLAAARAEEGARLVPALTGQLDRITQLTAEAAASAAAQGPAIHDRLAAQVAQLLGAVPALPAERLAQEAALLMVRADVREELDRLGAHVAQGRALLTEGGAVGRRLDFLSQELNREANTLCAKSTDVGLTRIGLELKAVIEQFREQVQNIE